MKMRLLVVSMLLVFGLPFIMSEVVDSFNECREIFFNKEPPTIEGVLENSVSLDNNRYKLICQKYKNIYRFATLYNITSRIPVFSAYKYTGHITWRPRIPWMIEPQLEDLTDAEMREPCVNQAFPGDYWTDKRLDRGHLFPNGHAADKDTAESTFTLTNTVPQYKKFNNGSWHSMEEQVRSFMDSYCRDKDNPDNILAYVLTGAVPSRNTLLNKRVNVPSHMWTAFYCYNGSDGTWVSQAHWAENKDEDKTIKAKTVKELESFLSEIYERRYKLFSDDSEISEISDAEITQLRILFHPWFRDSEQYHTFPIRRRTTKLRKIKSFRSV